MKRAGPFAVITLALSSGSVMAAATIDKPPSGYAAGRCVIQIDGQVYLRGRCFYQMAKDGFFEIFPASKIDSLYAQVEVLDGTTGAGRWNAEMGADFNGELGRMQRHGGCWTNPRARICLWRK